MIKKDKKICELEEEIVRLKGLLSTDGTNSGLPTSQTPTNKKKVIPNTRQKLKKWKGGQICHKKHKLEKFDDEEIKDELSYIFVPIKRRKSVWCWN